MNKSITILLMLLVVVCTALSQRLVPVPPDVIDGLAQTIKSDSAARMAALPTQTIYTLKRNGNYPVVSAISNTNYFLHIKAEAGTGPKPLLYPSPTASSTYTYAINFRKNGKLEGLIMEASRPTGGVQNRYINLYDGANLWVKDCEVLHDRGSAFAILSDSCSIFIEDCFVHSCGHPKSLGGNGRLVDIRATNFVDSIVVQNTTYFNLTDRVIRNMGTRVNFIKFDHNTGFATEGFHGGLQAGKTRNLIVTNNIFYNHIAFGSFKKRTAAAAATHEQTQPEKSLMHVVTLDTLYSDSKIVMRNNNIFWDQSYKDLWVKYKDSTEAPGYVTQTILGKLGADASKAYFTDPLTFQALPPSIYNFIDSALMAPNATVLPENWYFNYQDANGLGPINGSYGTTAKSYTSGDGGLPVGDLNWYPTKKAQWLLTGVEERTSEMIPSEFSLSQNYPNPFNPSTTIRFALAHSGVIDLAVYDMLGRKIATLSDGFHPAGEYTVPFDARGMASGVYFYTLSANGKVFSRQMVLVK